MQQDVLHCAVTKPRQAEQKVAQAQVQHATGRSALHSEQVKTGRTESCTSTGAACHSIQDILVCAGNMPQQRE